MRGHETVNGSVTKEEIALLNDNYRLTVTGKRVISENIRLIVDGDCSQNIYKNEKEDVGVI